MVIVFVVFAGFDAVQQFVVFPIESRLMPIYAQYANLIYSPHAVRASLTVIVGTQAFFALLPAMLLAGYFLCQATSRSLDTQTILRLPRERACSAARWSRRKFGLGAKRRNIAVVSSASIK